MKIPKTINIFSDKYRIIIEPDYFKNEDNPGLLCGDCDFNDKIIRIKKSEETIMLKTLMHEVIHAICFELNLYDNEHNENFIDRLSVGLVDAMLRNKLLKAEK